MTDERKAQLGVEVDSTGARKGFEDVTRSAKKAGADVAQAVKPAAQAVDGIGAGGAAAAQKVDRATQSMIASIQRTTAAAEAGERGTAKYFETLAAQRGISSDALRPYLQQLDAARAKQDAATTSLGALGTALGFVRTAMLALGPLWVANEVLNFVSNTLSAASALDDLADATGSSVSELSRLTNIARVSGTDFGTIDQAIKKLAVGIAGVDEESSKAGKALAAIGVSAKDPAQALNEIALKFAGYADGANKAALAVAIFGKTGANLLPVLKDIAENQDIAATVTAKQARDAEDLEKAWRRLGVESTTLKNALLDNVVPGLAAVITSFNLAKAAGFGFFEAVTKAGQYDLIKTQSQIAQIDAEIRKSQRMADDYAARGMKAPQETIEKKIAELQRQSAFLQSVLNTLITKMPERTPQSALPEAPRVPGGNEAKQQVADYADEIAKLNDEMLRATGADGGYTRYAAAWRQFMKDVAAGKATNTAQVVALLDTAKAADDLAKSIKDTSAQWEAYERYVKNANDEDNKAADAKLAANMAIKEQNEALRLEHETLGMTTSARAKYIVQMKLDAAIAREDANAVALLTEQLDLLSQQAADSAALKASEAWKQAADSISDSLTDALLRGFEDGKGFAKNFIDTLYNMFRTLVLRPVIQAIVAPVAGGITGALGFAGNAAASTGSSIGGFGSMFGAFGGNFGGGFSGALTNIGVEGLIGGTATNFAGIGGALSAGNIGGALGMAMPYIGAAVAIGMAVKGILDSKRGGPKTGGFASSGLIGDLPGSDGGRWFTPNGADASVQALANTTASAFKTTLQALGGTGAGGFAFGFDSDPEGRAPNRLHAGAYVNGQQVYDAPLSDLGRDDAALQAALELESKRALLAALQASDLPQQIAAAFDSVSAGGASATTIDNLLAFGNAMKVVIDAIGGDVAADAQTAWEASQRTTVQMLADMGAEVIRLAGAMDGSVTSMQNLATATTDYRSAVTQTLVAIKNIKSAVAEMFGATGESIRLFGKTPTQLYDYYMGDAETARGLLATEKDPARAQALATRINNDLNMAFNSLPEGQKGVMQPLLLEYLFGPDGAGGINAFVQTQLDRIWGEVDAGTADPFAAANAALDGAAVKFSSAADNSVTAANRALDAANINYQAAQINLQAAQTPVVAVVRPVSEVGG